MKNILLLDGDIGLLKLVRHTLEYRGYRAVGLAEAGLVTEHIRQQVPDLVVVDVELPGGDGRSVCRLLKNSAEYRSIPVILMSELSIESEELMLCEVNEFLLKPFNVAVLLGKIERLLFPERTALAFGI